MSIITYIAEEIEKREALLRKAADAYYNGVPTMSDAEYDNEWKNHLMDREATPGLFDDLQDGTILDKVGAAPAPTSGFRKVKHSYPMLSLDNVFENEQDGSEDLEKWLADVERICGPETGIVVEPKIDGCSLSLTYINGVLLEAITRGDGVTGDDVTDNVRASVMFPTNVRPLSESSMAIPAFGPATVRGEVFMDFATFGRLNAELVANGEEPYKNPRNAAAGAIRLQDPAECAKRGLRFLPHGVLDGGFKQHDSAMTFLHNAGFNTMRDCLHFMFEGPIKISSLRGIVTAGVDYPIDGLVFKINDYAKRELMGTTARAPRWATALKFQQEKVTTPLKAITVQVGRSGVLTPVAELEPIFVDGSVVSRATLHNEGQINRLGLQIGDEVEIRKAGAIIPELVRSVTGDSLLRERPPFSLMDHIGGKCPSCNGTDIQKQQVDGEDGARYQCRNPECPAQLAARIEHFASRKCLDIEMLGGEAATALADYLIANNAIDNYIDGDPVRSSTELLLSFMDFGVPSFAGLSWITDSGTQMTLGTKRAEKIVAALKRAKTLPLHRWLFALGISTVGENTSKEISRLCEELNEFRYACRPPEPVKNPNGGVIYRIANGEDKSTGSLQKYSISSHLGPVSCKALVEFCASTDGERVLYVIGEWDIKSDNYNPIPVASADKPLQGKTICITGTLSVGRDEMKALLEAAGAKVSGSISKKTDYLLAGEDCGGKLKKAGDLGVSVITETIARGML